jgi:Fe-S oxidoreductase/nitrate reductase gamma subunit
MTTKLIFLVIYAAALVVFFRRVWYLARLIRLGKSEKRTDRLPYRFSKLFTLVLGQGKVFKEPLSGLLHTFIFWAFLILVLGYFRAIFNVFLPNIHVPVLRSETYLALVDIFGLLAIVGVIIAALRRSVFRPERLEPSRSANLILLLIFLLIAVDFLADGFGAATDPDFGEASFVGEALGGLFAGTTGAEFLHQLFWWLHWIIIFVLMDYVPYSKHLHLMACPFNEFFLSTKPTGAIEHMDLEEAESFGATHITDYTRKDILDLYTCTECGRCQVTCPAFISEKALSPKKVILDLRDYLLDNGRALLNGDDENGPTEIAKNVIEESELWACTTCGACIARCPVSIEHIRKIMELRRFLVLDKSEFPQELNLLFRNVEKNYNPWGMGWASRADWAEDLNLLDMDDAKEADILLFAGCAASFDERNKKVAQSFVKLLDKAGIKAAYLGTEEKCCGDPVRRAGNEYLYQMMAMENVEVLKSFSGRIVTLCPHCFNTIKNEYPQLGGEFDVCHAVQYLDELVRSGKIKLKGDPESVFYLHDSCFLGRHNGIVNEPRNILGSFHASKIVKKPYEGDSSMCCGAGGARMWMEEDEGIRINQMRVREADGTNARRIITACPYCLTMYEDGIKEIGMEEKLQVSDITEVVCDHAE